MLKVEGLGKRYDSRWIFRQLSFELGQGDCLLVLGNNGSGKSTLLKTVSGLQQPTEGKITYPEGDIRLSLGLSALEMSLYPQLSVEEHLQLTGDLRGCPARTDELINFIALQDARKLPAYQLSTGMKARVKLAMAIQAKPLILMLDEPGASLDESGRSLIESVVKDQLTRGCVILATNDPSERRFATHELALGS